MITIQIDNKKYQQTKGDWVMLRCVNDWIYEGYLEEVKENKEHPGTICEFGYTDTPYALEILTPGQAKDFIETSPHDRR